MTEGVVSQASPAGSPRPSKTHNSDSGLPAALLNNVRRGARCAHFVKGSEPWERAAESRGHGDAFRVRPRSAQRRDNAATESDKNQPAASRHAAAPHSNSYHRPARGQVRRGRRPLGVLHFAQIGHNGTAKLLISRHKTRYELNARRYKASHRAQSTDAGRCGDRYPCRQNEPSGEASAAENTANGRYKRLTISGCP